MKHAYTKYLLSLLLMGFNGVVVSMIDMQSASLAFVRAIIGSFFLIGVFVISRKKLMLFKAGKESLYLILSGAAMGANWLFLFEAYQHVGVSIGMLANYCAPILVMVAATVVFKEKLTKSKIIGLATVVVGMLCVNGITILQEGFSWGLLCGLMSACMFALTIICNKKVTKIEGVEGSMWQLITAGILTGIFLLATQQGSIVVPLPSIAPLLWLGVIGTGLSLFLYFSSVQALSAQTVSVCGYLEPLSAVVFSSLFLGEMLAPLQIVGACLILSGAAIGELISSKKLRHAFVKRLPRHGSKTAARG